MKQNKAKNLKQNEKNKKPKKQESSVKKFFLKLFIFIFIIAFIVGISFLGIKLYIFKTLAKEMFNNTPSTVLDSNKNIIAEIGAERNRENVDFSAIPKQLVNAYVSIEDERFYTHHGVDVKRTGAAILSYIFKRWLHLFWW